jgi:hypothetical protein
VLAQDDSRLVREQQLANSSWQLANQPREQDLLASCEIFNIQRSVKSKATPTAPHDSAQGGILVGAGKGTQPGGGYGPLFIFGLCGFVVGTTASAMAVLGFMWS